MERSEGLSAAGKGAEHMTKTVLVIAAVVLTVLPAQASPVAFLIRVGADGAKDVDWSGSITPAPRRLAGWQLDGKDQISGSTWKCMTREERYWDTPYEARMGPTSNRDKVTAKGIVVEYDAPPSGEIRLITRQGTFSFPAAAGL